MHVKSKAPQGKFACPSCGGGTMIDYEFNELVVEAKARCISCRRVDNLRIVNVESYAENSLKRSIWYKYQEENSIPYFLLRDWCLQISPDLLSIVSSTLRYEQGRDDEEMVNKSYLIAKLRAFLRDICCNRLGIQLRELIGKLKGE